MAAGVEQGGEHKGEALFWRLCCRGLGRCSLGGGKAGTGGVSYAAEGRRAGRETAAKWRPPNRARPGGGGGGSPVYGQRQGVYPGGSLCTASPSMPCGTLPCLPAFVSAMMPDIFINAACLAIPHLGSP